MSLKNKSLGFLLIFCFLLAGCETTNPNENLVPIAPVSSLKANKKMHPQIAYAFSLLREEKFAEASSYINLTLQTHPKSVMLHTLNGLAYEKLAENGDPKSYELAMVGYQNAINLDPFNVFALIQLGKIKFREQLYDQAQEHFANALLIKPNDPDLIHELAAASYYAYDIKTAVAAIRKAEQLKPEDPLIQRSATLIYAAIGDFQKAEKHFKLFHAKLGDDPEITHVMNRFNDWKSLYKSGRIHLAADTSSNSNSSSLNPLSNASGQGGSSDSSPPTDGTQGNANSSSPADGTQGSSDPNPPAADTQAPEHKDVGLTVDKPVPDEGDNPTPEQFKEGEPNKNVIDAPVTPGIGSASIEGKATGATVEQAATPQQVIVDCYILQITEDANTSKGNNVLADLALTLNPGSFLKFKGSLWGDGTMPKGSGTDNITFRPDSAYATNVLNSTQGNAPSTTYNTSNTDMTLNSNGSVSGRIFTAGITWAGLTYSLNIANAQDSRTEIVSRPTLITFLKKESRFFSGTELVNVGSGQYGSNVNRYPIGVTIAVIPESIIDDMITLSIGVEASILESPNPNLLTTVDVGKTRIETYARVRLGETIMLGGIYERDEVDRKTGFPGLQDVPVLQYFFSNELTISSRRSIAILLTPRSPDVVKSAVNRAMTRESVRPHFQELVSRNPDWFNPDTNAVNIFSYISLDPVLYYEFRTGDILPPSWGYEPALKDNLGLLASFLYY